MWLLVVAALILILILLKKLNKDYYILAGAKRVRTTDGSDLSSKVIQIPGKTIFGNNFDIVTADPASIWQFWRDCLRESNGKSYLVYFIYGPIYNITTAEDSEEILQSQNFITKSMLYALLQWFLGEGVLISTGEKWHFRRKTLTPAFHFNVLQGFLEIFKSETDKFLNILEKKVNQVLPLHDVIPRFALNNVCETALGVKLDKIEGSEEYLKSIHMIEKFNVERVCNPFLYNDKIFELWGDSANQLRKYLKIAHDFSSRIVNEKRNVFLKSKDKDSKKEEEINDVGQKKRYAMLDTLLDTELKGLIDHKGICEEVDTFMFEGFDTTSACLTFTLLHLAEHREVQERCFKELEQFASISEMTVFDFSQLEYLECVIKESLRLCPSVPFLARETTEPDMKVNGLILPKGTQIFIHVFDILRDPKHYPDPEKFDPDRFLPKNTTDRHPFAFIPFSAGPRNCIGQKFAMLEMKTLLAAIIKQFVILPVTRMEDIVFCTGFVLRYFDEISVKIEKRK